MLEWMCPESHVKEVNDPDQAFELALYYHSPRCGPGSWGLTRCWRVIALGFLIVGRSWAVDFFR